jgi:hypothetical protein
MGECGFHVSVGPGAVIGERGWAGLWIRLFTIKLSGADFMAVNKATDFRTLLRGRLDHDGWEVAAIDDDTDWWVDQHWKIKSTRQANGLTLFLNFMVDPMYEGADKSGAVWSITASTCLPSGRTDTKNQIAEMVLQTGRLIPNLNEFICQLNTYRDSHHRSQHVS